MPNTPTNACSQPADGCVSTTFSGAVPDAFSGGYWILLAPLSAGTHTIHVTANSNAVPSLSIGAFSSDVTYNLTVE